MGSSGTGPRPFMRALLLCSVLALAGGSDVREPPSIKEPSVAKDLFLREGAKVTLNCQASGTPDPMYEWYWNDVQVTSSTNADMSFDGASGSLVITDLDEKKEGFFNCRARNTFPDGITAVAISHKIQVRVARVGSWTVGAGVTTYTGSEGTYMQLPCDENLPTYYGPIDFKWYIVEGGTQFEHTLDDRQFIDARGTLHFTYLKTTDQSGDGRYYACALSNAISGNIQAGSKKKLTVTPSAKIEDVPPIKQYTSEIVEFKRHSEAKLECFFSGYSRENGVAQPFPITTWYDEGNNEITTQSHYKIEEEGRLMKIEDLSESDEGQYYCKGSNSQGTSTGTVSLNVTSAPIWVNRLQKTTVPQGRDAEFMCESRSASGETAPGPPRWYRNAIRFDVNYDSNKYEFSMDKRKLTVKGAQKDSDIACFQCYVSNSVGEVFSDGCLNVILPITIVSQPAPQQEINEGDLVNLTVVGTSDPLVPLSYRWIFKNVTYDDPNAPPLVVYNPDTRTAYINTSGFTDSQMEDIAGLYRREVYHTYQKKIVDVDVTLEDEPVVVPVTEAGFDYWIIGLIIGILLIIIVIIIICCVICRRKMLEGDYPVDKKETAAGLDPEKEVADSGFHDLSRADYDFLPEKKSPNMDLEDQIPLGDDESFGSAEYGEEATAFNEDGSFIGIYSKGKKAGGPPAYNAESNV